MTAVHQQPFVVLVLRTGPGGHAGGRRLPQRPWSVRVGTIHCGLAAGTKRTPGMRAKSPSSAQTSIPEAIAVAPIHRSFASTASPFRASVAAASVYARDTVTSTGIGLNVARTPSTKADRF